MIIIPFENQYLDDIRHINVAVSSHPNKPLAEKKLCQYLYIDYYTIYSKDNCFIALENDEVVGYVISENNFARFKNHILNEYMSTAISLDPKFEEYLINELKPYEKYNDTYDCHLHMDVKPGFQHQGVGTQLIQHELKHLKEIGAKGCMLQVSKANERANKFYEKNGLALIDVLGSNIRGIKFD